MVITEVTFSRRKFITKGCRAAGGSALSYPTTPLQPQAAYSSFWNQFPVEPRSAGATMPLAFPVPAVVENEDGWGPCTVPEHLKDVPFAPFSKGDKIGRAGDWNQSAYGNKFGE